MEENKGTAQFDLVTVLPSLVSPSHTTIYTKRSIGFMSFYIDVRSKQCFTFPVPAIQND